MYVLIHIEVELREFIESIACIFIYKNTHICVYICTNTRMDMHRRKDHFYGVFTYICTYTYICKCMYHIHTHIHIYIHVYVQTSEDHFRGDTLVLPQI